MSFSFININNYIFKSLFLESQRREPRGPLIYLLIGELI